MPSDFTTPYINLKADNTEEGGPKFVSPADGDYTLATGSPLIDAGLTTANPQEIDAAGHERINGTAIDLGCYEYIPGSTTGFESLNTQMKGNKVLRNGMPFILRDGKTYNVLGQEL